MEGVVVLREHIKVSRQGGVGDNTLPKQLPVKGGPLFASKLSQKRNSLAAVGVLYCEQ